MVIRSKQGSMLTHKEGLGIRKKDSTRNTHRSGTVRNVITHDYILEFFVTFGSGPFEIEAIVYFVLLRMDVTPYDYNRVTAGIRTYIVDNFNVTKGDIRSREDVHMRQMLVTHKI